MSSRAGHRLLILRMVPETWRTRYRDEVVDALAVSQTRLKDSLDVIAWGARLRMDAGRTAYRPIVALALVTACLLLVPLVAMQFSDEVSWTLADFVAAGVLLYGAGLVYQLVARKAATVSYRLAAAVALGSALMLVWAALAVGIIGVEGDPADLMYGGVLALGIIGAIVGRFEAPAMARTLFATAFAQALVAGIALVAGKHEAPMSSVAEIVLVNAFFVALFLVSGLLFRYAARERHPVSARSEG